MLETTNTVCCYTSYIRPKAIIAWTPLDPGIVFSATKMLTVYPLSPINYMSHILKCCLCRLDLSRTAYSLIVNSIRLIEM